MQLHSDFRRKRLAFWPHTRLRLSLSNLVYLRSIIADVPRVVISRINFVLEKHKLITLKAKELNTYINKYKNNPEIAINFRCSNILRIVRWLIFYFLSNSPYITSSIHFSDLTDQSSLMKSLFAERLKDIFMLKIYENKIFLRLYIRDYLKYTLFATSE